MYPFNFVRCQKFQRYGAGLIVLLNTLACSTPASIAPTAEPPKMVGVQVATALDEALARVKEQKQASLQVQQLADLSASPGSKINLRWEGEADLILKQIAQQQGLKYKRTGTAPYLPIPVFIRLQAVTMVQALEAIGDQLGGRATVVLHDDVLELRMN